MLVTIQSGPRGGGRTSEMSSQRDGGAASAADPKDTVFDDMPDEQVR